jgi:MYXO-CTERM domain-containing protein
MHRYIAALGVAVGACGADGAVVFTGVDTSGRSAMAEFSVNGSGELVVTLTNTSLNDVLVPSEVLTALLFDISGAGLPLTRESAVLGAGSTVFYDVDGQPAGGVVGGEWAYRGGLIGAPGDRGYGISSTGIDLFGPGDIFPGPDLSPPINPNGLNYGILSAGDDPATGNGGVMGSGGLIRNSVVFTLGGAGVDFDLSRINRVQFFYGTSVGEGSIDGVPTPGSLALLGLAGLLIHRRRR